jgi:hypothetical protein
MTGAPTLARMPVTPFHFGPGALLKSAAPGHVSWMTFALANALIDLEPIFLFVAIGVPAHPWLHTFPGALAVAAAAALAGRRPCEAALRWWNSRLSPAQSRWLSEPPLIAVRAAWTGALLGTTTHVLLDAFMHGDVRILWPVSDDNPLYGVVPLVPLHWGCVLAGAAGLALLAYRRSRT